MPSTNIAPVGVSGQTTETTVYSVPFGTEFSGRVRFVNNDSVARTLNAWKNSGGSPTDADRLVPKDYSLAAGAFLDVPVALPAFWQVVFTADVNDGIVAYPMGIETTL